MTDVILVGVHDKGLACRHAEVLARIPDVRVAAVCDLEVEHAESFIQHHRLNAVAYESIEEALVKTKADYVVLMTPREIRECAVVACVRQSVPIWMEAPPCRSMSEGMNIAAILETSRLCHGVGFMHRYNEALNAAIAMLGGQAISTLHISMQSCMDEKSNGFGQPSLAAHKTNILSNQALHYVDLCRYITSAEITRIVGAAGCRQASPHEGFPREIDTAAWVLQMGTDTLVTYNHTCRAPRWSAGLEIVTHQSRVRVDLFENSAEGSINGHAWSFKGTECELEMQHRAFLGAVMAGDGGPVRSTYSDALESFRDIGYINSIIHGHCHDLD